MILYYFVVFVTLNVVIGERRPPLRPQNSRSYSSASAVAHSQSSSTSSHSSSSSYSSSSSKSIGNTCDEYDRCNDRNATYKKCPNPCPSTCVNPEGVKDCYRLCEQFGCECKRGYVESDNGKCIRLKDCPDYLRCKGDRNATFKECPNPCPRTCQFPGGSGPCSKMCIKEGCECKEGYYLSENGECVQFQDCPGASECSANETFVFCNAGCPTNNCPEDDSRAIIACSPPYPCGSGCSCKGNYLRLSSEHDRCILASDCPPVTCTRQNEVWDGCPPPCLNERCSDIGKPNPCDRRFHSCRPQCVCKPGFYRNDNDLCVPEKECDYLRCNGDRNATYKECPNPCPRTCQFPGGSGPCSKMCLKEGCECNEGYYLSENGKCVQLQDCPGASKCSANETFVFCKVGCPTNNCPKDDSRAIVACSPPYPCGSGCSCKGNYLRLSSESDRCILASDCPPVTCTRQNEIWDGCPPPCLNERCSDIGKPNPCDRRFHSCRPQCVCKPGFYRDNNDLCVPEKECPPKCGYNEMAVECRTICPPQVCENSYTEYACGKSICEPGCDCIPNHLRNSSGICILNDLCPPPPTIPVCGLNEELSSCMRVCPPQTCESIYTLYLCSENISCEWGCNCINGYLRNSSGVCIPSDKCPNGPLIGCGFNEVPTDCAITCPPQTCNSIFTTYFCENNTVCKPGCNCLDKHLRNESGICIPSDECFVEQCDIPTNCRSTCANPIPKNCSSVNPPTDNQDGCKCKPGYILSDVNGVCIRIEECPADQGCNGDPNAIATSCPWPCPSTCDSPNNGYCKRKCDAVGCQCKPGFLLNQENGKCILPDECECGNPCGVNGTFSDCGFRCPNQNCPVDDSQIVIACKPGRPCPPGCLCKEYYKRNENDVCVLASDCTPVECTRPNEVWNPCASECLAEDCSNIYQKPDCYADPNNCIPKCVCCDGYFRNETGYCVPKAKCKIQCPVRPECRPTCAVPNPPGCPFIQPSENNDDSCNCQKGYILSKIGGECIKIEECPADTGCNGDPHARVKENPLSCPSTCDAPNAMPCEMSDPIGCECAPGYILSKTGGQCILPDKCEGGNPCGPNATFGGCLNYCPSTYCPVDDSRAILICETSPFAPCYTGCNCRLNHKRLSRDDPWCIRSDECPPVNCTRSHEKWNPCPMDCSSGYCDEVDQPPITCNTLVLNCNPQCVCKKSFYRNPENDICVSSKECRKINAKNQ